MIAIGRASRGVRAAVVVAMCLSGGRAVASAGGDLPYLYQRGGFGHEVPVSVELETAYGTRDAIPFGARGLEQGVRVRAPMPGGVVFETWLGALVSGEGEPALAVDATVPLLRVGPGALALGLGYTKDFTGVHVPRVRATAMAKAAGMEAMGFAELQAPLAEDRDSADIILGLAAATQVAQWAKVGLEAEGQDLEGFWEPDEAEGGARFLAGPTAWLHLMGGLYAKANLAAVLQATTSSATRETSSGLLTRIVVGWGFF